MAGTIRNNKWIYIYDAKLKKLYSFHHSRMGDDDVFDDSAEGEILIRERDLHRMSQDLYKVPSKRKNAVYSGIIPALF